MNEYTRLVLGALHAAGSPGADERARIYDQCRGQVATAHSDGIERIRALEELEKTIRRQKMQAIYEEGLGG